MESIYPLSKRRATAYIISYLENLHWSSKFDETYRSNAELKFWFGAKALGYSSWTCEFIPRVTSDSFSLFRECNSASHTWIRGCATRTAARIRRYKTSTQRRAQKGPSKAAENKSLVNLGIRHARCPARAYRNGLRYRENTMRAGHTPRYAALLPINDLFALNAGSYWGNLSGWYRSFGMRNPWFTL